MNGRNPQLLSRNLLNNGNQDDFMNNNYQNSEYENNIEKEQNDIDLEDESLNFLNKDFEENLDVLKQQNRLDVPEIPRQLPMSTEKKQLNSTNNTSLQASIQQKPQNEVSSSKDDCIDELLKD